MTINTDETVSDPPPEWMCHALVSAVNALTYVTQPEFWPGFVAWMEAGGGGINGPSEAVRRDLRINHLKHLMEVVSCGQS